MHCIMLMPRRFCPAVPYLIYSWPHDLLPFVSWAAVYSIPDILFRSKVALCNHATLKGLAGLQLLPSIDSADLHADKSLVSILGPEVGGSLGLRDPRVPHDGVFEIVAGDVEEGLAVLQHGGGVLLDGLVDAVGLAGDLDGGIGLGVLGSIEDFVGVSCGAETVDLELGDVLRM